MQNILDFFKKYGVYVVVALGLVFNVGAIAGAWSPSTATWASIDGIIGMLGFGSIRVSVAALLGELDLTPITGFLNGYKTYITAAIGVIWFALSSFHVVPADNPWVIFADTVLGALGFGFLKAGIAKYHQSLKLALSMPGGLKLKR